MGFRDTFKDRLVVIRVIDDLDSEMDNKYWVQGKIADETDEYLVIENPLIGYDYSISEAKEIIINKKFITSIHESYPGDLERRVLERYRKNRLDWGIYLIIFAFGVAGAIFTLILVP